MHVPDWHVELGGHAFPHAPQLLLSLPFTSMHVPPQSTCPAGQLQEPFWQVFPPLQTFPQPPQLLLSVAVSVQAPLHTFWPVGQTQVPLLQD